MADENWQKVREIFDSALRRKPEERQNYIVEICGEDKTLLLEVESLLASFDGADSFMETPAVAKVAEVIEAETKKLERGKCFGHYEIIKQIGTGGMGEVYLANDKKLDRRVAVKILNEKFSGQESNLNRFIREAKAASSLNHPNILVIHEIGETGEIHYIVSEYVEGKTLREVFNVEKLELKEVFDISIQIANALSTAHSAHLIHRDIKPENIMIRPDGYVKILDFGLAKLVGQKNSFANPGNNFGRHNETTKGLILGTINYMSPEQAKGERVDERTDIFSFGIMLYEMIAGRTPFAGDSVPETLANLINSEPLPFRHFSEDSPDELQRIVFKMLRKNADERYQTMKDILADLKVLRENPASGEHLEKSLPPDTKNTTKIGKWATGDTNLQTDETDSDFSWQNKRRPFAALKVLTDFFAAIGFGQAATKQIESVAVLPFVNIAADPETEYLSDGISENLIDRLSQLPQLKVIARSSSFKYRGENTDIINAAKQLGVQAIITGRVARRGDNLSIRVEMVDAWDNRQLWSEQYNRQAADLQFVQQEIAQTVSENLRLKLSGAQKQEIAKQNAVNPQAYELLLKGHSHRNKKGTENKMKAAVYYQQAIDIDPAYAAAHAALSVSFSDLTHNSILDPKEFTHKAEAAARKALELDENLADAHDAMALIELNGWNWAAAEQEYQRAIELSPNFAKVHSCYAFYLSLVGRHDEAVAAFKLSKEMNPLAPVANTDIGYALYMARRYDEAQEILNNALEMDRENPYTNGILAHTYLGKGMYAEAIAGFRRVMELGGEPGYRIYLGAAYAKSGEREQAQEILEQLETSESYVSPGELAILYVALDEREQAFVSLERAYDAHDAQLQFLLIEPAFDPLRSDPHFQDLLCRVGLSQINYPVIPGRRQIKSIFDIELSTAAKIADVTEAETKHPESENSLRPESNKQTKKKLLTTIREKKQIFLNDWNFTFASKRRRKKIIICFCAVFIFSILSMIFYRFSKPENTVEPFRQVKLSRLTNNGKVGNFALSPDGNLIVYETKEKEGVSVWVRQIEMSNSVNLVPLKKGNITFLTFSPDNKFVYYGFFAGDHSTAELYSVPALGGASHKIKTDIATNFMSFAPDGRHYAQVNSYLKASEKYLVINSLDDNEEIRLATRKSPGSFNITGQFCAWSPDGKTIAAISNDTDADGQFSTLVGVSATDGSENPLSAKRWNELGGVQWLKDGSGLLVLGSDAPQARSQIWFVSAADGEARRLTNDLNDYSYIGVTADSKQIVAVQEIRTSSIWLGTIGQNENDFNELVSETGTLDTIALTANDDIVFRSNADGKPNLWTIGDGGSGRKQITVDAQVDGRGLCAAPGQIVFPSRKAGKVNLWRVAVNGGDAKQLTFGDGEFFPACLPDNRGVIYQKGSGYGIKSTLWKISPDGGEPIQLTDYYAIRPALSPDGLHVAFFYIANEKWSVGTVSSDGGGIEQSFDLPDGVLDRTIRWSPDGQSLFYIDNDGNVGNVWLLSLNGQLPKQVTKFNSQLLADFAPTRHSKKAVVTRTVKLSDVVIISEE